MPYQREARLIVTNVFLGLLNNGHRNYFADVTYAESVMATVLSAHIFAAEATDQPMTEGRLAALVGIPPARLRPRLHYLREKEFVIRGIDGLRLNGAALQIEPMSTSIRESGQLIIDGGEALKPLFA
jgi:hypothetical protein